MRTLTPVGVRDLTPDESQHEEERLSAMRSVYERHAYQGLVTPTIEFFDTLAPVMTQNLRDTCIKFFDSEKRTLVLRPDHTLQIARMVAARMRDAALPIRVSYEGPVFRREQGGELELMQSGVECMGLPGVEAEAEIIALCIEVLKKVGFSEIMVDIGHVSFLDSLSDVQKRHLLEGNYEALGYLPQAGGLNLVQDSPSLLALYKILDQQGLSSHLRFNRGLVSSISYYTGIVFDVYLPELNRIVASGGRYDHLVRQFGYDIPAVGFAFHSLESWERI